MRHVQRGHGDRVRARRAGAPSEHRVVQLQALKRRIAAQLRLVADALDAELVAARAADVPYATIAHEVLVAEGKPQTAENVARVENVLRVATHAAQRRIRAANANGVARSGNKRDARDVMLRLRKRVIEYYADDGLDVGLGGVDDFDVDDLDARLRELRERDQHARGDDEHDDDNDREERRDDHNREDR